MVLEKNIKTYALLSIFRDYLSIRKGSTLFYKNLDSTSHKDALYEDD